MKNGSVLLKIFDFQATGSIFTYTCSLFEDVDEETEQL